MIISLIFVFWLHMCHGQFNSNSPRNITPNYGAAVPMPQINRPTLYPQPHFRAAADAMALRDAMRGFGTDEDALISVLCKRTVVQRLEIVKIFKINYGKDLIDEIKGETNGNFRDLLLILLQPTIELYVTDLHDALARLGTETNTLLDVLPVLNNREMREVNLLYDQKYGKTLEKKLTDDTSGGFRRLLVALSTGNRDESRMTNVLTARSDAQTIKSVIVAGETEEIAVNQILCQRNFEQIKLIDQEYQKLTGHSLDDAIKEKFSGDLQSGLKSILRYALNPNKFFASRLYKAMEGIGTRNKSLNRIIVTRSEVDMENIKAAYKLEYNDTLRSDIGGDTSGDYKHALYTLIGELEKPKK